MPGDPTPHRDDIDVFPPARSLFGSALRVLATSGYGLWLLLGLALALGVYPSGRGDALVPLALGALLVSLNPLAALLRLPAAEAWLGWRFGRGSRPTRRAMLAMVTYLPMLGVAGLARGDNLFWATRLSAAALALCSLACLLYAIPARAGGREGWARWFARIVSAGYAGGLWLWLCLAAQESAHPRAIYSVAWILALQLLALLFWLASRRERGRAFASRPGLIFVALVYLIPCVVVLLAQLHEPRELLIGLAAVSCVIGKSVESRLWRETVVGGT